MNATTILFCDVVGYSKLNVDDQKNLIIRLNAEVYHELFSYLRTVTGIPSIISLPTGDGMALAFIHNNNSWCKVIFGLINRLMEWSVKVSVKLRIGIHTGTISVIPDINGNVNICGSTINYCQRVMDGANENQVLFSQMAYWEYLGIDNNKYIVEPFSEQDPAIFNGPFIIFAKHELQIPVYVMHRGENNKAWDNMPPHAKSQMIVKISQLPRNIEGTFSDRLANAEKIALVQLTGESLIKKLKDSNNDSKIHLSENLKKFWVYMLDPEVYKNIAITDHGANIADYVNEWKDYLRILHEKRPDIDIKMGLYHYPYLGASFVDWDRPNGIIHVAPYIWGVKAIYSPGFDVVWKGETRSEIYEAYLKGLEHLNIYSKEIQL